MLTVLVVDDNVQIRDALKIDLEAQAGLKVIGEAADGIAGFQLAQSLRPDIILMDVGMARMDGVEATRCIRALLPRTVLIGMSCHGSRMVEKAVLSAGANAFLSKDALPDQLLTVISQEVHRRA